MSLLLRHEQVPIMEEQHRWLLQTNSTSTTNDDRSAMDLFSAIMSNILLFFLIFGLSATVQIKNLKKQLQNKFALATGVAMQFLIMPILGFLSVSAFREQGFTKAMGVTLLVVTASPGGSFSNWWCSMFNADLALSVAMTSVSSILSIGLLPANLFLYTFLAFGQDEEESILEALDFETIFITLGLVMAAIVLGLYSGYRWDNDAFHIGANRLGSICGLFLILFSVFLSSGGGGTDEDGDGKPDESTNFFSHPWAFYVGVAAPCLAGITLANLISRTFRLSGPEAVAISIECCYQNTGIATSVAVTMFDGHERAEAVAVPLFYGVVEAIVIGVYCVWAWKVGWTKAPPNEHICTVITKTYELEDDDEDEQTPSQSQELRTDEDDATGVMLNDDETLVSASNMPDDATAVKDAAANSTAARSGFWSKLFRRHSVVNRRRPTNEEFGRPRGDSQDAMLGSPSPNKPSKRKSSEDATINTEDSMLGTPNQNNNTNASLGMIQEGMVDKQEEYEVSYSPQEKEQVLRRRMEDAAALY